MTEKEFDKLIEKTLVENGERLFTDPEAPDHSFTPEFDKKVMTAAKGGKKKKGQILRIFAGIGAAAAVLVIGIVAVSIMKNGFGNIPVSDQTAMPDNAAADTVEGKNISSDSSAPAERNNDTVDNAAAAATDNAAENKNNEINDGSYGGKNLDIADNTAEPSGDNKGVESEQSIVREDTADDEPSATENLAPAAEASEKPAEEPDEKPAEEPDDMAGDPAGIVPSSAVIAMGKGEILTFSSEEAAAITETAKKYVSDPDKAVKSDFTADSLDYYTDEGWFITVSVSGFAIEDPDGEEREVSMITLLIGEDESFAIAEGYGLYQCFGIPDTSEIMAIIDK